MPPKPRANYKSKPAVSKPKFVTTLNADISNAKFLVIVESPSKCSKIEHYLGSNYKCIASKGHIRELVGLKSIDIKKQFHPTFTIVPEKKEHVEQMRKIIERFSKSSILIATDDDREGEGIAWHICQVFDLPVETTTRIVFHEITKTAILAAVASPIRINMNLVYAQHARQILDIIVGFKISPLLWKHIRSGKTKALSAGRCQTPALRLVYENSKKCEGTEIEMRYKTVGHFFSHNLAFELNHEFEDSESVQIFLDKSKTHQHSLTLGSPRDTKKSAPKPFNTSRLLQTASNVLHSSPKQTMQTCQKLYQDGHITYMRTDNIKYSSDFLETFRIFVQDSEYWGDLDSLENKDETNPHEAIRCTQLFVQELPENTDASQAAMYRLIWRNTIESCMADARYKATTASINAPSINKKQLSYTHILEIPVFLGWKKSWTNSKIMEETKEKDTKDDAQSTLFYLQQLTDTTRTNVPYTYIESTVVMRNQIAHYTEAGLIQILEDLGIGRPSTFAMLVDTVQDRGYVKCTDIPGKTQECIEYKLREGGILDKLTLQKTFGKEKNKLRIQPIGILCIEFLTKHFERLFSYDYTKSMEDILDQIAHYEKNTDNPWYEICQTCSNDIDELSKTLVSLGKESFPLDSEHELVFGPFGPVIKHTNSEGIMSYIQVKPGLDIDVSKARQGGYSLTELVAFDKEILGMYENNPLKLRVGKFGPYLEWGTKTQSIRDFGLPLDKMDLDAAISFLEKNKEEPVDPNAPRLPPPPKGKGILRVLTTDMSVREGKFGPYVYYKTGDMTKPTFCNLKKFKGNPTTCDSTLLIQWIQQTYLTIV